MRDDASIARELNRPVTSVRKMAEKLFPPVVEDGPWSDEDVEQLKRYLGASSVDVIARVLRRSVAAVEEQIAKLGERLEPREWTREEVAEFKRIYGTRTDDDLVRIFGRPKGAVEELATRYALAKDKAFLRRLKGDASTRMPRWTTEEVEQLKDDYPTTPNVELAQALGRSLKSVVSKAHNLGLKKSPDRLRAMGRENVSLRYHPERVVHPRPAPEKAAPTAGREPAEATPEAVKELRPRPAAEPASGERTYELRPAPREDATEEASAAGEARAAEKVRRSEERPKAGKPGVEDGPRVGERRDDAD